MMVWKSNNLEQILLSAKRIWLVDKWIPLETPLVVFPFCISAGKTNIHKATSIDTLPNYLFKIFCWYGWNRPTCWWLALFWEQEGVGPLFKCQVKQINLEEPRSKSKRLGNKMETNSFSCHPLSVPTSITCSPPILTSSSVPSGLKVT